MKIAPFTLERYFEQYEHHVPYVLCASDVEALTLQELMTLAPEAQDDFSRLSLGYAEVKGSERLRHAIAQCYQTMAVENIHVHTGSAEAIFNTLNTLLCPTDHVIVHWPSYQSLYEVAHSVGCQVSYWKTSDTHHWQLALDQLESLIQPNTRMVVVNLPHNPTGSSMSPADWTAFITLLKKHGIWLLSDEVYRLMEHHPEETRLPAACDLYENAISIGSMSKAVSLPGLRIGWVASQNRQWIEALGVIKDYTTICSSTPSQFLAALALENQEAILARNQQIIHDNLATLTAFLADYPEYFRWIPPQAGCIAFPHLNSNRPIQDICRQLAQEKGVFLLPGTLYHYPDNYFRIGFGRRNFTECLKHFASFLETAMIPLAGSTH